MFRKNILTQPNGNSTFYREPGEVFHQVSGQLISSGGTNRANIYLLYSFFHDGRYYGDLFLGHGLDKGFKVLRSAMAG